MNPDDPVCLCFHVSRRKVTNFIRIERPRRPSQLSQCFGAGTGCGWCRPYLERILERELASQGIAIQKSAYQIDQAENQPKNEEKLANSDEGSSATQSDKSQPGIEDLSSAEYARMRSKYVKEGGGTPPPGATPVDLPENE